MVDHLILEERHKFLETIDRNAEDDKFYATLILQIK